MIPAPRSLRESDDRFEVTDGKAERDELAALIRQHDGNIMAAFRAIMAMPREQQDRLLAQADA